MTAPDIDAIENGGKRWHGIERRTVNVRWEPYKPDGQRQMKAKGRWQEQVGSGDFWSWQNLVGRPANVEGQPDAPPPDFITLDAATAREIENLLVAICAGCEAVMADHDPGQGVSIDGFAAAMRTANFARDAARTIALNADHGSAALAKLRERL